MAIDGSKYHYWRNKFIQTGSLKAFDLMTRHYAADPDNCRSVEVPSPVGRRHKTYPAPVIFIPVRSSTPDMMWLAHQDHVHDSNGICIKNRYGPRCLTYAGKFLGIDTYIDPDEPTDLGWHFETVTTKEGLL